MNKKISFDLGGSNVEVEVYVRDSAVKGTNDDGARKALCHALESSIERVINLLLVDESQKFLDGVWEEAQKELAVEAKARLAEARNPSPPNPLVSAYFSEDDQGLYVPMRRIPDGSDA